MGRRGQIKYVPSNVMDELDSISKEENLLNNSELFRRLANYSRIGREVNKKR